MTVPATEREIAMFGHIAAAMRAAMAAKDMELADLNVALKLPRGHTSAYKWLAAKAAPGPANRRKIAKALGIPADQLMRRDPGNAIAVAAPQALQIEGPRRTPQAGATTPVLQFAVLDDGTARIRLDVSLPAAQAVPLLRLLLDAGMIVGGATG